MRRLGHMQLCAMNLPPELLGAEVLGFEHLILHSLTRLAIMVQVPFTTVHGLTPGATRMACGPLLSRKAYNFHTLHPRWARRPTTLLIYALRIGIAGGLTKFRTINSWQAHLFPVTMV